MYVANLLGGLVFAALSAVPAIAEGGERMSLGLPQGVAAEFQNRAGDRVFFAESSAELGARALAAIDAQAAWLLQHPSLAITIEGHADDWGSTRENLELAERRAAAVRKSLIVRGVAAERIATISFGRTRRAADCAEPMCRAQNRRSITVLIPAPGAATSAGR